MTVISLHCVLPNGRGSKSTNVNRPLITIGLSAYNVEATILAVISSIVSQAYEHLELIPEQNKAPKRWFLNPDNSTRNFLLSFWEKTIILQYANSTNFTYLPALQ